MTPPPDSLSVCPRCGSTSAEPLAHGGVCLRCAGLRALSLGAADLSATETGERIGPYDVVEELGRGGMGRVVAACQPGHDRIVAVKSIRTGVDPELELRFRREIQTLSRLRHPNIVAIHDSGRADDSLYFSMDYIEGGDLASKLRTRPLPWREAVPLLRKVARALVYLHAQGVLHRDLKPSNILLDDLEPKLADFGLAAQLEAGDLTALTRILGTPHYLAPEALLKGSTAATAAGDLYSFGVVLYETLTGRTPFAGASPEGLLNLVQTSEPPAIRQLVPSVPRDLETICLKCLDRDPARRYVSAAELAEDLTRFQDGRPILARPISRAEQLLRWTRRRPHLAAVWLLIVTIAVGSSFATLRIAREHARAEAALVQANSANTLARERLREARLAEATAVVHTTNPGRRAQALAAVAEAAGVRPGVDLRNAALAALTTVDAEPVATWDLQCPDPAESVFSADGKVAAQRLRSPSTEGTDKHTILLRRHGRNEPLGVIETPSPILGPLAFNADGSRLAVRLEDATLRIWSTDPVAPVCTLEHLAIPGAWPRPDQNADYALSPSGQQLAVGRPGGGIDIVSLPDAHVVATWTSPQVVQMLEYSPDGRWLAAGRVEDSNDRRVTLLDGHSAQPAATMEISGAWQGLLWTADSRLVGLVSTDSGCTWFSLGDGRRITRTNLPCDGWQRATALEQNDLMPLRLTGTSLGLADSGTGRLELVFPGAGPNERVAVVDGREILITSIDNAVTHWRPTPRPGWRIIRSALPPSVGYGIGPWAMDTSADSRWIALADGNHLIVQDTATGRTAAMMEVDPKIFQQSTAAFSADGTRLWRVSTYSGITSHAFSVSVDGRNVSIGPALIADPVKGFVLESVAADRRALAIVNFQSGTVRVLRVSADGRQIDSQVEWSAPGVYSAAFSPDATRLLVNCTGQGPEAATHRLRVYRTLDGAVERELPAEARGEAVWCADGSTAMTSNGTSRSMIWNTADWTQRCVLDGQLGGDPTTFTLAPDGRTALIVRDSRAHLVATQDGATLASLELTGADGFCLSVRASGPGKFAALQLDGRLDLLDIAAWNAELTKLGLGW